VQHRGQRGEAARQELARAPPRVCCLGLIIGVIVIVIGVIVIVVPVSATRLSIDDRRADRPVRVAGHAAQADPVHEGVLHRAAAAGAATGAGAGITRDSTSDITRGSTGDSTGGSASDSTRDSTGCSTAAPARGGRSGDRCRPATMMKMKLNYTAENRYCAAAPTEPTTP
jgi:hypothetical protein